MGTRVVAVDWSGEKRNNGRKKIWAATSAHGHLVCLETGKGREETVEHLIRAADEDSGLVVGLDFAFSMPEWFVRSRGARSAKEFWGIVEEQGEQWLGDCPSPFFGHPATKRPPTDQMFRRTDLEVPAVGGLSPKSVFQIAGGGQVGPGSIRGMPLLTRLAENGFRVWPFDAAAEGEPLVVEIYPRLLTGPVVKNSGDGRQEHLRHYALQIGSQHADMAAEGEDQFDAAVSAAVMNRYLNEIITLHEGDGVDLVEGRIWRPSDPVFVAGRGLPAFHDPETPKADGD